MLCGLRQRFFGLLRRTAATFAFKQQAGDQHGLEQQNRESTQDLPTVLAP